MRRRVVSAGRLLLVGAQRRPQTTPKTSLPSPVAGVPLCGDDPAALEQVGTLVRDLGCEPVAAGGVRRARLLEATAALVIGVWLSGGDVRAMFPPLAAAFRSVRPRRLRANVA